MMLRELRTCLGLFILLGALTGIGYPFAVLGIGQTLFPDQANGSLIKNGDTVIGSTLIGQNFTTPGYFHGRPSYAGKGYDAGNSSGSNLAPSSADLLKAVTDRVAVYKAQNALEHVPIDLVTASASGLDPDISVESAQLQAGRVAHSRNLPVTEVNQLICDYTANRTLGILGENRVNVLLLNMALDRKAPAKP